MKLQVLIKKCLIALGLLKKYREIKFRRNYKLFLRHFPIEKRKYFIYTGDPVRYGSIELAINTIKQENIDGSFAELGVYKGATSRFIHMLAPEKRFYLFDTFEGFPTSDLENVNDSRFKGTSIDLVKSNIGNLENIIIKKGYFPDSSIGLENELYSFVMLDADLYKPTFAGLEYFYPRMVKGGYLFIHDYNSSESNYAVSKAVNEFLKSKPEKLIEIPDMGGSVILRKL